MNNKKTLTGILTSSAILAGCNFLEKNEDILIGDYSFEKEAYSYAYKELENIHEKMDMEISQENLNELILELAEFHDYNQNKKIDLKEVKKGIDSIWYMR
tara:strand:+ start:105 stop:404 length:300 start_codon:yes stop_codon:yes gene_type:complete